jgi:hypothetical protein
MWLVILWYLTIPSDSKGSCAPVCQDPPICAACGRSRNVGNLAIPQAIDDLTWTGLPKPVVEDANKRITATRSARRDPAMSGSRWSVSLGNPRPPQHSGVLLSHTGRSTQHCSVKPFQALKIDQNTSWLRPCEAQHWKKHKLVCRPASTSETQFSQLSSETEISIGEALAAQHDTGEVRVINRGNGDKLGSKMSI